MLKLKLQYFGHLMLRNDSLEKTLMLERIESRRRRGRQRVRWLDRHEFEQALGGGDGQGSLACCSPWGRKEWDMTEQLNWTELNWTERSFWKDLNPQRWGHEKRRAQWHFGSRKASMVLIWHIQESWEASWPWGMVGLSLNYLQKPQKAQEYGIKYLQKGREQKWELVKSWLANIRSLNPLPHFILMEDCLSPNPDKIKEGFGGFCLFPRGVKQRGFLLWRKPGTVKGMGIL